MKVRLFILEDRMPYLIQKLVERNIKILNYDKETSEIFFELKDSLDVLSLYHAGITIGIDETKKLYR